jgi:hypothetical protein
LNDAGFLTIDKDVSDCFDICFLDWNTTGSTHFDDEKLKYIVGVLINKKVAPVFLLLARKDNNLNNRLCDRQVIDLCEKYNIPYLDLRSCLDVELHLRDDVHTNELGAKIYAELILNQIKKINFLGITNVDVKHKNFDINIPKFLPLDLPEGGVLNLSLAEISSQAEVIFAVVHGPSSGYISVDNKKICIWDRWSHYERNGFISVKNYINAEVDNVETLLEIEVLSDLVDYSICSREFNYDGIKYFKIRGIYGVNCVVTSVKSSNRKCK